MQEMFLFIENILRQSDVLSFVILVKELGVAASKISKKEGEYFSI